MLLQHYAPRLLIAHLVGPQGGEGACCTRLEGIILFVDIVNSTGLTDDFARQGTDGAERLAAILNRYFGRVIEVVAAHGGDTVRIDGDAVIALWHPGAGRGDLGRLAAMAAAAALALQSKFRNWQPVAGVTLRHRITIVSGAIQFIVLSERAGRRFFVVAGDPIRQLADPRLRGEPEEVIVSDPVAGLLTEAATLSRTACGGFELLALPVIVAEPGARIPELQEPPALGCADVEALVEPFLPRVVVDRIAAGQASWLAEFRKLSVVYVNLAGLAEAAPDVAQRVEDAVRTIEAAVQSLGIEISNVVATEKGFIVQIACGLPPFAQEHNAVIAVEAARRILPALASIGVGAAIGVTTGHAFCGDVGSEGRREYMSTGPVMGYAARLMQIAVNEIICDDLTARAAAGQTGFSDPESVAVKGRAEPLVIRRLREHAQARLRDPTGAGVIFGRAGELQLLTERLARLAQGRGGIAAIDAEPGAGKTHLLSRIADAARTFRYRAVTAATSPIEQTTAYFVFREILPQLLREPADPPDLAPAMLRARLAELLRDNPLAAKAALLEDILPLAFTDQGLVPDIKGPARVAGIEELLAHIAGERAASSPVVILLDDLQWIDASSANLLASTSQRVQRMLVVLTTRPVDEGSSAHAATLIDMASPTVRLARLPRDAIKAIVCERLGVPGVPVELVDFIQTRSEGLPFFAEQLLFALRDQGVLVIEDGRCRLSTADLSAMAAPDSLRDLIVSRVDRLTPTRQLTIKVASAVGRVFDEDLVRAVHPLISSIPSMDEVLDQLINAGFLNRSLDAGRKTYSFRHGIIQGVTYDLMTYAQRRPLHASIARYLETKHGAALTPHFATLAEHWERAADADRAIAYRIDAADIAAQRYANEDALNHLERVDRLVADFRTEVPVPALAHYTRIRADAFQELTRFPEANAQYRTLARLQGIAVATSRAQSIAGVAKEASLQALRRIGLVTGLSRGAEQDRDRLAAHIYMRFAEHAYFTNDTLGLAHATIASLNRAERAQSLPEIVNASGGLALGLAAVGMLPWARYYRDRSIRLATTAGSPSAQGFAELLACVQSFHTGDWDGMGVHGARGAAIWQTLGDRYRQQCCLVLEGYRLIAMGRYREADRALLIFGEEAEDIDSAQVRAWALAARALLDLLLGRPPAVAMTRIATASADGGLHPAERLLCGGIAAAAHLEAADFPAALSAAESALENMLQGSPAMAGALLFSVPCVAEVLLVLSAHATAVGRTREDLLARAKVACDAAQGFAARNRICRPRAGLLRGYLAAELGRAHVARGCFRAALGDAHRLGLPLEQAMSHFALSVTPGTAADRRDHGQRAGEILRRLGVVWAPWERFRIGTTSPSTAGVGIETT